MKSPCHRRLQGSVSSVHGPLRSVHLAVPRAKSDTLKVRSPDFIPRIAPSKPVSWCTRDLATRWDYTRLIARSLKTAISYCRSSEAISHIEVSNTRPSGTGRCSPPWQSPASNPFAGLENSTAYAPTVEVISRRQDDRQDRLGGRMVALNGSPGPHQNRPGESYLSI